MVEDCLIYYKDTVCLKPKNSRFHLAPTPILLAGIYYRYAATPLKFTRGNMEQFGGLVHVKFAKAHGYLISDPDLIQQVLSTDNRIWHKSQVYKNVLSDYLGNGLLISDGDYWRRQRKLMQPTFHTKRIYTYAETMGDYIQKMLGEWQGSEIQDIDKEMMRLTLRVVGKTLFDVDFNNDSGKVAVALTHMLHDIVSESQALIHLPDWIPTPLRMRKKTHCRYAGRSHHAYHRRAAGIWRRYRRLYYQCWLWRKMMMA